MTSNPPPPKAGQAQTDFHREPRYLVTKIKDAVKYLSPTERDTLERLSAKCGLGRKDDGKRNLICVVVESDWPEFEPTWAAIEARMTGKQAPGLKEAIIAGLEDSEIVESNETCAQIADNILTRITASSSHSSLLASHERLKQALESFVTAEDRFRKEALVPGQMDDALSDAYDQARTALSTVPSVNNG